MEEAIAIARLHQEDLVVLLLDFKKAYNRVDLAFLDSTMLRMGFGSRNPPLYSVAHSQVLIHREDRFPISRFVRHGCPLLRLDRRLTLGG